MTYQWHIRHEQMAGGSHLAIAFLTQGDDWKPLDYVAAHSAESASEAERILRQGIMTDYPNGGVPDEEYPLKGCINV